MGFCSLGNPHPLGHAGNTGAGKTTLMKDLGNTPMGITPIVQRTWRFLFKTQIHFSCPKSVEKNDDELIGNALGWANTLAGPHIRHPRTRWLIIIFPLKSPFWVAHFQIQLYVQILLAVQWFRWSCHGARDLAKETKPCPSQTSWDSDRITQHRESSTAAWASSHGLQRPSTLPYYQFSCKHSNQFHTSQLLKHQVIGNQCLIFILG